MEKQVIFGVYDKTTNCDTYTGYFRHEDDAKKELVTQMDYVKQNEGIQDLKLKNDRVVRESGRQEEIFFIIHPIMLR
jgi:hypothetical protein